MIFMTVENNMLQKIFTPWRLTRYPLVFLFALVAGYLIVIFSGEGASIISGRLGGDYPAFYAAGKIIAEGNWNDLYNPGKQAMMQKGLFPDMGNVFMPFPYPPFVAAAYYPLSLMEYRLSFTVYTILLVSAVFLSVWLLRPMHELIGKYYLFFVCVVLSFYPMLRAVLGGQNTAISFLILVISWRAVLAKKQILAGFILGLLLFKPHFALPLIGLFILSGHWRIGLGAILSAAILYMVGSLISGPFWVAEWYRFTSWLAVADAGINYDKSISFVGFFQAIMGWKNHLALILGWIMSLGCSSYLAYVWLIENRKLDYTAMFGLTISALVLIPPHVNYYDLGLAIFSCFAIAHRNKENPWLPLGIIWLLGFTQPISSYLGFSLLFPVALLCFVWSIRVLTQSAIQPISP